MASSVAVADLETHLAEVLARVEGGEEIVVERDGRPAVKMVPAGQENILTPLSPADDLPFKGVPIKPGNWDAPLTEEEIVRMMPDLSGMEMAPPEVRAMRVFGQNRLGVTYVAPDCFDPMTDEELADWGM